MRVIAVLNQKGGVGKTTSTINIAAYLAKQHKKKVLVVDLDPQGNATSGLGHDKAQISSSTYDVLLGKKTLKEATLATQWEDLALLPCNPQLAGVEVELVGLEGRELKLKEALKGAVYDFILIDCPPSLGLLTINALTAADEILIPVQTEYYALEGLSQLLSVVQKIREHLNPELKLLGVVLTMYDTRTSLSGQVRDEVKKHFNDKVFTTMIPRNVRLAEAPSHGLPVMNYDKWSKGARAYKALTKEVVDRG